MIKYLIDGLSYMIAFINFMIVIRIKPLGYLIDK
jgi:hypothetical protein